MKKWIITALFFIFLGGGMLWTCTEPAFAKEGNQISPDSPIYFLDRLAEEVTLFFLPAEKKVGFQLKISQERFDEAVEMQRKGKSDKASKLFHDGLKSVGNALGSWKRCLEKEIDLSGLRKDLQEVISGAKTTFSQLRKEIQPEKLGEFIKELADVTKEQIEVLLNK